MASIPFTGPDVIQRIPQTGTDLVELRLDYFEELENLDLGILENFRDRLILTIREPAEGGVAPVDPGVKEKILRKAVAAGFLIDMEISVLGRVSIDHGNQILSRHFLDSDPPYEELENLAKNYAGRCSILKIALRKSDDSSGHLISLLNRHHNLAVMETDGDPASRIVYSILGSRLMYCHTGEKTSPGQMGCAEASRILGLLARMK